MTDQSKFSKDFNIKDWGDLYLHVIFKDGSEWKEVFKRNLELDKNLELRKTNKFINSFLEGADLMTQSNIKQKLKAWLTTTESTDVLSIKWEIA